jgi:predicted  nucleic acid-binding Zn-ribbon protein
MSQQLEPIIKELQSLAGKKSPSDIRRAKTLMAQMRKMGFTNAEVSQLTNEGWKESTVKKYTQGITIDNPGPKNNAIKLLNEHIEMGLSLNDVKQTISTSKILSNKHLNLEDLSTFLNETKSSGVETGDLIRIYREIKKAKLSINQLKQIFQYKKNLESKKVTIEHLATIQQATNQYGGPKYVLEAIVSFGKLKNIERDLQTFKQQKVEQKKQISDLEEDLTSLTEQKKKITEELVLYKKLEDDGFTLNVLNQLKLASNKYGGPAKCLETINKYTKTIELEKQISDLKTKKKGIEAELKKLQADQAHLQHVIQICNTLLYKYGYSITAIQTLEKVCEKYGGVYKVIEAIGKYGHLKDLENEIQEISTRKAGLQSSVNELQRQTESLRNEVNQLTETTGDSLTSISEKFTTETEKLTKTFNDTTNSISSNIKLFQENIAKAYRDSLEDIYEKIPETLRNLGKLDEKIEKIKSLALTLAIIEKPAEIREDTINVLASALAYTKGLETYVQINETRMEKSLFLKQSISDLVNKLTEGVRDGLRSKDKS